VHQCAFSYLFHFTLVNAHSYPVILHRIITKENITELERWLVLIAKRLKYVVDEGDNKKTEGRRQT